MQSTLDLIAEWMTRQPWYSPSPDGFPRLRELAELFLPSGTTGVRARILLVRDDAHGEPVLYQVALIERDTPEPGLTGLIGAGYGGVALYDAIDDPAFPAALLGALRDAGSLRYPDDDRFIVSSALIEDGDAAVLRIDPYGRPGIRARIARRVTDGGDPDAAAAIALADAGVGGAPRLVGVLGISWTEDGAEHVAHLAHLSEAAESEDGWTRFVAAARSGADPTDDARRLGEALARTHLALADSARPSTTEESAGVVAGWRTRLAGAVREIPAVAARVDGVSALHDAASALAPWPAVQVIHGALDLSTTRRSADGSWFLTGFAAGDPRPAEDRVDVPVRDVAGALRSLHYAAVIGGADAEWADAARRSILDGYAEVAGDDALPAALLDAIEADYALLDAVWESRARPRALRVPLAALDRLLDGVLAEPESRTAAA